MWQYTKIMPTGVIQGHFKTKIAKIGTQNVWKNAQILSNLSVKGAERSPGSIKGDWL